MADATVLNTVGFYPCGFESRLRHIADLQDGNSDDSVEHARESVRLLLNCRPIAAQLQR